MQFVECPLFDENEWVRYVVRKIYDEFMWLRKSFMISKDAIKLVTSLCSSSDFPTLKSVKNQLITITTRPRFDKMKMTINDILEYDVKFSSMVIGYKTYHSSQENSVSGTIIYASYEMIKENKGYDLCEFLQSEMKKNLTKIK